MVLNVSKDFKDIEQKFETVGKGSNLQRCKLHNTDKMFEDL